MRFKYKIYRLLFNLFPLRKPPLTGLPASVVFLPHDALGDVIVTSPVFRELKLAFPQINIGVIATKRNAAVLISNPYVDRVHISNGKNYFVNRAERDFINEVKAAQYDLVVDMWDRASFLKLLQLRLFKPRKLVGLQKPPKAELRKKFSTHELGLYSEIIPTDFTNFRTYMLSALNYFGLKSNEPRGDVALTPQNIEFAHHYLQQVLKFKQDSPKLCFINIYGSRSANSLSLEILTQLIETFHTETNYFILLSSGGNSENEKLLTSAIPSVYQNRGQVLPATTGILDVAALIKQCELVVSTNTGIMHIAEAYRKPLILLQRQAACDEHQNFPALSHPERMIVADQHDFTKKLRLVLHSI